MLRVVRDEQARIRRRSTAPWAYVLIAWATAWFVGFGALWSGETTGGNPWFRIPDAVAWPLFSILLAIAVAFSIVTSVRAQTGVRGPSTRMGTMYGWSWTISMIGVWLILMTLPRLGASEELKSLMFPGMFVLATGMLYLAGGALMNSLAQYLLGIVLIATAVGATFVGVPHHYAFYATVGPFAMVVLAVLLLVGKIREGSDAV